MSECVCVCVCVYACVCVFEGVNLLCIPISLPPLCTHPSVQTNWFNCVQTYVLLFVWLLCVVHVCVCMCVCVCVHVRLTASESEVVFCVLSCGTKGYKAGTLLIHVDDITHNRPFRKTLPPLQDFNTHTHRHTHTHTHTHTHRD